MPEVWRGFILQAATRVRGRVPVIQLHGVLEGGGAFLLEEDRFRPYFFVDAVGAARLEGEPAVALESVALRDLAGREVVRVTAELPADVPRLRERVRGAGGTPLEADVPFPQRFLIDRGVRQALRLCGESTVSGEPPLRLFRNPELAPCDFRPELRALSLDLETDPRARRILCAALVGCGVDEVHLVSAAPVADAVVHPDEASLLAALAERVRRIDPDVLTGWNVVDFDLRVLQRRCDALRMRAPFGRVEGAIAVRAEPGFARRSRAELPGRQVVDAMDLVRDASIPLDDYRLETAAQAILGRGKLLEGEGPERAQEIERLHREDPAALVAYNREDARLVLDILEKEALLELAIERSLLSGMPLDRVGASIASFDRVYLPELRRRGAVAPSVDAERKTARVLGGAVLDSTPGFFANVAVLDFRSLYPSLMRTFHLDPLAHARAGEDAVTAPNGARFSREEAILPAILEELAASRQRARARGDRHADLALKILANSFFGVLGAANCRFFDPDVANAITSFGQQTLAWTREAIEAEGVPVLYGDTDSVFVALDRTASASSARAAARALRERVQERIVGRIRETYRVEPVLELEVERVYERFFQPRVRGGRQGSKKRYAGLAGGELRVVGLEAVRRDWPRAARALQLGMLERAFRDEPVLPFVRQVVERVQAGELDADLVIRKGLRKGSVERYTRASAPHVEAARRAGATLRGVIRYVVTRRGPEPVLPGRPLPADIDRAHYVDQVLRPVARAILEPLGLHFEDALGTPRQLDLL